MKPALARSTQRWGPLCVLGFGVWLIIWGLVWLLSYFKYGHFYDHKFQVEYVGTEALVVSMAPLLFGIFFSLSGFLSLRKAGKQT